MAIEAEAKDVATRLQAEFPHALENGQIVAYFQPEVELSSGKVVAAEALARWEHPALGTLSPGLFVPLAEKLGLMAEFTQRMFRLFSPSTGSGPPTGGTSRSRSTSDPIA